MKKILCIDDDKNFCDLVRANLDEHAYELTAVFDGDEGLAAVKQNAPDLILLDIMMPKMSGVEFLEKLRTLDTGKNIPVIVTSNDSSLDTISRGAELGVRGYIVKSNQPMHDIVAAIDRTLAEKNK